MSWQHSPHRRGALLILSLRQSYLHQNPHKALLRQVWGGRNTGDPKRVRAYVKRVRRKLGDDAADPAYIVNECGVVLPHAPTGRRVRAERPASSS